MRYLQQYYEYLGTENTSCLDNGVISVALSENQFPESKERLLLISYQSIKTHNLCQISISVSEPNESVECVCGIISSLPTINSKLLETSRKQWENGIWKEKENKAQLARFEKSRKIRGKNIKKLTKRRRRSLSEQGNRRKKEGGRFKCLFGFQGMLERWKDVGIKGLLCDKDYCNRASLLRCL